MGRNRTALIEVGPLILYLVESISVSPIVPVRFVVVTFFLVSEPISSVVVSDKPLKRIG